MTTPLQIYISRWILARLNALLECHQLSPLKQREHVCGNFRLSSQRYRLHQPSLFMTILTPSSADSWTTKQFREDLDDTKTPLAGEASNCS